MTSTAGAEDILPERGRDARRVPGTIFTAGGERGGRGAGGRYVKLGGRREGEGREHDERDEPALDRGAAPGRHSRALQQLRQAADRGDGRAGCENCGNIEERKFADDFGTQNQSNHELINPSNPDRVKKMLVQVSREGRARVHRRGDGRRLFSRRDNPPRTLG